MRCRRWVGRHKSQLHSLSPASKFSKHGKSLFLQQDLLLQKERKNLFQHRTGLTFAKDSVNFPGGLMTCRCLYSSYSTCPGQRLWHFVFVFPSFERWTRAPWPKFQALTKLVSEFRANVVCQKDTSEAYLTFFREAKEEF